MAQAFNISTFKSSGLTRGGVRPALFQVILSSPPAFTLDNPSLTKFSFTCEAAELPDSTIGVVEAPYFGRKIKLQGDRVFADWTVTVQNDEDFTVRSMFESWNNSLNSMESNLRSTAYEFGDNAYKSTMNIVQFDKSGNAIRQYNMIGAWPNKIGSIKVDWNTQNAIEKFDVIFSYDYWLPDGSSDAGQSASNQYLASATTPSPDGTTLFKR